MEKDLLYAMGHMFKSQSAVLRAVNNKSDHELKFALEELHNAESSLRRAAAKIGETESFRNFLTPQKTWF